MMPNLFSDVRMKRDKTDKLIMKPISTKAVIHKKVNEIKFSSIVEVG